MRLATFLLAALVLAAPAAAQDVFLQGANSSTVSNLLIPRTSGCGGGESCPSCNCGFTALGMVLGYWDDFTHDGEGPWETLLPGGDQSSESAYRAATQSLFNISGLGHCEGFGGIVFIGLCNDALDTSERYTNEQLGFGFVYDADDWVWFGNDVADEIDAARPVYYAAYPWYTSGSQGHAITVVGYNAGNESLWYFDTLDHSLHVKGFDVNPQGDPITDHCVINITPRTCEPQSCNDLNKDCGVWNNGCDESVYCGECDVGYECNTSGRCVEEEVCDANQFRCDNDQCIASGYRCDHDSDCDDTSDEWGCSPCGGTQFRCDNNICIPNYLVCDYQNGCNDGSDEQGCGDCSTSQYRCPDGSCESDYDDCSTCTAKSCSELGRECGRWDNGCGGWVDCGGCSGGQTCTADGQCTGTCTPETCATLGRQCGRWDDDCDGTVDCGGCPGDQECSASGQCVTSGCPDGQWACADGSCIASASHCDYQVDCDDASDELGCTPCVAERFRCDNDVCLQKELRCNYANDCGDGSDEQGCGSCQNWQYRCLDGSCVGTWAECDPDNDCPDVDGDGHRDHRCGGDDCDDTNATVYLGAPERCDGADNDCNSQVDEAPECHTTLPDDGSGCGCQGMPRSGGPPTIGLLLLLCLTLRRRV